MPWAGAVGLRTHDTEGMGKAEKTSSVRSEAVTTETPEVAVAAGTRPGRRQSVLAVSVAVALGVAGVRPRRRRRRGRLRVWHLGPGAGGRLVTRRRWRR